MAGFVTGGGVVFAAGRVVASLADEADVEAEDASLAGGVTPGFVDGVAGAGCFAAGVSFAGAGDFCRAAPIGGAAGAAGAAGGAGDCAGPAGLFCWLG